VLFRVGIDRMIVFRDRRFRFAVAGYAAGVMAMVALSFATDDTIGPAVYLTAATLTLPVGVAIYPALWVNVFFVAVLAHVIPGASRFASPLTLAGVIVVFGSAAVANALILRELWRAARRIDLPRFPVFPPGARSLPAVLAVSHGGASRRSAPSAWTRLRLMFCR
jgi:hypothetical protein